MLAYAVCVEPLYSRKRKSVFADDGQPGPSGLFKRSCLTHVGRDQTAAQFGLSVPSQSYVWVPCSARAHSRVFAAGGVPMQRIVAPSLVAYAQPCALRTSPASDPATAHRGQGAQRLADRHDLDEMDLRALRISYPHLAEAQLR